MPKKIAFKMFLKKLVYLYFQEEIGKQNENANITLLAL